MECKRNNEDELSETGLYERIHFAIEFKSNPLKYDYGA